MNESWRGRLEAGREMTRRQTLRLAYRTKGCGEVLLKIFGFFVFCFFKLGTKRKYKCLCLKTQVGGAGKMAQGVSPNNYVVAHNHL